MQELLEPKLDKIVVSPDIQENTTESGIILLDKENVIPTRGTVIAVGKGTDDEDMELKVGDKVIFKKHTGTTWENEGKSYIFMRQSDVLAVIEND